MNRRLNPRIDQEGFFGAGPHGASHRTRGIRRARHLGKPLCVRAVRLDLDGDAVPVIHAALYDSTEFTGGLEEEVVDSSLAAGEVLDVAKADCTPEGAGVQT